MFQWMLFCFATKNKLDIPQYQPWVHQNLNSNDMRRLKGYADV